ncbi:MAG: hypothetical protein KKB20_23425, partial [Proteobacteria bacterium]|nr:hypothetical protein [Pseudomonadota bacterium]
GLRGRQPDFRPGLRRAQGDLKPAPAVVVKKLATSGCRLYNIIDINMLPVDVSGGPAKLMGKSCRPKPGPAPIREGLMPNIQLIPYRYKN